MADVPEALRAAVDGRYAIERELGRGGMATVFLARDQKHSRSVALKVLRPDIAAALGAERFSREIEIAARLSHPHILPLHESGEAGGFLYYVMPYVEGESLRDRLRREAQLPLEDALQIAREVGGALDYAHGQGVIHRDIKPENILLSGGHAVVADFGIARALTASGGSLTETGLALGTPAYMSPEQGSGSRAVDARSDLYSLACVLYEMLSGHPPFLGSTGHEVLARHALDTVPPLRTGRTTVPLAVEQATLKALAKVPADRYSSAAQFIAALADRPTASGSAGRSRPMRVWWTLGGGLALATMLLVVLNFRVWNRPIASSGAAELSRIRSLAVLPLENRGSDSTLGDPMTEAITTDLGRVNGLRVISRSAVTKYKASTLPVPEIGRTLGVDAVLGGNVERLGDSIRVDLSLIEAATGNRIWARRLGERFANRVQVGAEISRTLMAALKLPVTSSAERTLRPLLTSNPEAWDEFLRGKIHVQRENPADDSIAIGLFEHALTLDPVFAAAYAELGHAYGLRVFLYAPEDRAAWEKGQLVAEKALRLDPDLAEAHYARGFLLWTPAAHYAHELAIQEYLRALELNPNYDDAHHQLALIYEHIGLFEKSIEEYRKTMALNPGNRVTQLQEGWAFSTQGQYEEGLRIARQVPPEFSPSIWYSNVAWALVELGRDEEAASVIEGYLKAWPKDPGGVVISVRAIIHAKAGDKLAAERDIKKAQLGRGYGQYHHAAHHIASAYALLKQPMLAVEWLRRAVEDGLPCYPLFASDPNLNSLRQDRGFIALMADLKVQWERWKKTL